MSVTSEAFRGIIWAHPYAYQEAEKWTSVIASTWRAACSNHRDNLFPQLTEDNRGKYRDLENELAKEVAAKKDVRMSVDLVYPEDDEDSHRPDYVYVTYSIDGEETVRKFDNRRDS